MESAQTKANLLKDEGVLDPRWKGLYKTAAISALIVVIMIPLQSVVYFVSPPPDTVLGWFALFQKSKFLGLLGLDLLLTLDNLLMIPLYLALYVSLRKKNESLMLTATVVGLISLTLYFVSREATFSMMALSGQYAAAATEAEKAALVAAGQTMLAIYDGSSFDVSYVLGGLFVFLASLAMLRSKAFGKAPAVIGIVMGVLMLAPPTLGTVGIVVSFLSLIPSFVWLIMMSRRFFRFSREAL